MKRQRRGALRSLSPHQSPEERASLSPQKGPGPSQPGGIWSKTGPSQPGGCSPDLLFHQHKQWHRQNKILKGNHNICNQRLYSFFFHTMLHRVLSYGLVSVLTCTKSHSFCNTFLYTLYFFDLIFFHFNTHTLYRGTMKMFIGGKTRTSPCVLLSPYIVRVKINNAKTRSSRGFQSHWLKRQRRRIRRKGRQRPR